MNTESIELVRYVFINYIKDQQKNPDTHIDDASEIVCEQKKNKNKRAQEIIMNAATRSSLSIKS